MPIDRTVLPKTTIDQILEANAVATGARAFVSQRALQLVFHYVGQGLTGTVTFRYDLRQSEYIDRYDFAVIEEARGFDGKRA